MTAQLIASLDETCFSGASRWALSAKERPYLHEFTFVSSRLHVKVVSGLEVHPKSIRCAECSGQAKRGVGTDTPFTVNDLVDASRRNCYRLGKTVLADAQRNQKLFEENLSRVNGLVCGSHNISSQ